MTTHRFYIPEPLSASGEGALQEQQARQARKVLRLRSGDEVVVFDGSGAEYTATLGEPSKDGWAFRTGEASYPGREPALRLTVGLAIIRNERFDMAVQKLTELGVARIVPLVTERGVISYDDARAWERRRGRLERIVIEAAEQSERTTLPALHEPLSTSEFLSHFREVDTIALVERTAPLHLANIPPSGESALMVGPEGGWSPGELDRLAGSAVTTASLGGLILRAETAAIVSAGHIIIASAADRRRTS